MFIGGTTVVDVRDDADAERFEILAERGVAPLVMRAKLLLLATGGRERFLPFPGWTLPGVVGVGGAQALLKSGLRVESRQIVISGSGPLLLPVAASLTAAHARVLLVAEQASSASVRQFARGLWRRPGALVQAARYRAVFRRTPYVTGTWVTSARGDGRVEEVTVTNGRTERSLKCDMLCAAFGLVPNLRLAQLIGCEATPAGVSVNEHQRTSHPRVYAAGEAAGIAGVEQALVQVRIAAAAMLGESPAHGLLKRRDTLAAMAAAMARAFALRDELRHLAAAETIVCRCEDVRLGALHRDWTTRQAKLYTRVGMGACQGRVCGAALEFLNDWPPDTTRLPLAPALVSTMLAVAGNEADNRHE
jgi:NADPH-dependent 2,4-dienoyl-CoA reductase/sulfur reductase-like enzyme